MGSFKYTAEIEDEGKSIKVIFKEKFSFSSRLMTKFKQNKSVFLNGEPMPCWVPVHEGDVIEARVPDECSDFPPEDMPINVVFEDENLLVINKQSGYVVHPTKGQPCNTMANGIMQYMLDTKQSFKIRFINRLDRDTTGLLLVGKNSHSQDAVTKQMKQNAIEKRYIAIVNGIMEDEEGTVNAPIGRPDPDAVERAVMPDGGKESVTHYKVLNRYPDKGRGYTIVELLLETGRTHQIRVHMSYIGHPVTGDHLYGGLVFKNHSPVPYCTMTEREEMQKQGNMLLINRQALHAYSLSLTHPVSKKMLLLKAELPEDMQRLIAEIK